MRLHALLMMGALAVAAQAWADEPRHVRVLWDVQGQRACAIAAVLQAPFTFAVPSEWPCGTGSDPVPSAGWTPVRSGVVRPGDYVTVYAIRYNPVSYKALTPVVTTLKPEEPIGITLFAAVIRATVGVSAPTFTPAGGGDRPPPPAPPPAAACGTADACLAAIGAAIRDVERAAGRWDTDFKLRARQLSADRGEVPAKLADVADPYADLTFGIAGLEALACDFSVEDGKNPLGSPCTTGTQAPGTAGPEGWVQQIGAALGRAYALVRIFDSTPWAEVAAAQAAQLARYKAALTGWVEYLTSTAGGVRSELSAGAAKLADDLAAIKSFRRAMSPRNASAYAVEVARQGPVGSLNRLIFALPLRPVDAPDGAPAARSYTLTLEVAANMPVAMASAGVLWLPSGTFGFKTLALEQIPNGSGGLSRRLVQAGDTRYRDVTAVAASHFRLSRDGWYATLGTTADKNIFRSVLVGGSYFAPRLRSLITVAALSAKGSKAKDLDPVIARYSTNGVVPDGLTLTQISAEEHWYWTWTLAWTLTPF